MPSSACKKKTTEIYTSVNTLSLHDALPISVVSDADVDVVVTVTPVAPDAVDENGWPVGFFERVAGSMPDLRRGSQGEFEERLPLG